MEEFRKWLTADQAFGHLPNGLTPELVDSLMRRLLDGKLASAAAEARWRENGRVKVKRLIAIDPGWWLNALDAERVASPIWSLSEMTCRIDDETDSDSFSVNFYGVRFEWDALYDVVPGLRGRRAMAGVNAALRMAGPDLGALPRLRAALPAPTTVLTAYERSAAAVQANLAELSSSVSEGALPKAPKPPVSNATLKAWWELCKTVRPAEAWTKDQMRDFFDQCFPDKFATRDQLRDVRGKQQPGPKAKSAE